MADAADAESQHELRRQARAERAARRTSARTWLATARADELAAAAGVSADAWRALSFAQQHKAVKKIVRARVSGDSPPAADVDGAPRRTWRRHGVRAARADAGDATGRQHERRMQRFQAREAARLARDQTRLATAEAAALAAAVRAADASSALPDAAEPHTLIVDVAALCAADPLHAALAQQSRTRAAQAMVHRLVDYARLVPAPPGGRELVCALERSNHYCRMQVPRACAVRVLEARRSERVVDVVVAAAATALADGRRALVVSGSEEAAMIYARQAGATGVGCGVLVAAMDAALREWPTYSESYSACSSSSSSSSSSSGHGGGDTGSSCVQQHHPRAP